ncbi:unnamed protein product, partial [Mesorhabditis belari]|uniref:Uncharacterized protein n=1 Tax=Mesorhabditis belari TaxID=2138241 RepID=A0AAF3J382_9BILA
MSVFKSLNCILCKEPFAQSADQPRTPRLLGCGLVMCHECCEKEKSLAKRERKHRCNSVYCFENPKFAHFLIDVLSLDSLTFSQSGHGYLLLKPFKIPECLICHDEYSSNIEAKNCTSEVVCAFTKHRSPEAISLMEKRACELNVEQQKDLTEVCDKNKSFLEGHKCDGAFFQKLLGNEMCFTNVFNFVEFRKKHELLTKSLAAVEVFMENYQSHLLQLSVDIMALNETLDMDLNN